MHARNIFIIKGQVRIKLRSVSVTVQYWALSDMLYYTGEAGRG